MEEKNKKNKIKNKFYKEFIETGIIQTINKTDFKKVLDNVEHRQTEQCKNLLRVLFYTGCRPKEALMLKAKDFKQEGKYCKVIIPSVKRGVSRTIFLNLSDPEINTLFDWTQKHYPEIILFWVLKSNKTRTNIKAKLKNGVTKTYTDVYEDTTNNLRHWFKKWFNVLDPDGHTPYFLRHNHFSRLSEAGASMEDIMMVKGARSIESVRPYLHMSTRKAKSIAKLKLD